MALKHKLSTRLARLWPAPVVLITLLAPGCELQRNVAGLSSGEVSQVVLTPSTITINTDDSADFTAVGLTSTGDTADFTITWAATGGTVTDMGNSRGRHLGRYKAGKTCGSFKITASAKPGSASDTSTATVVCPVASVEVTPTSSTLSVGATVQLTAMPKDANNNVLTGRTVTWSSSAPAVATVTQTGRVNALGGGSATIMATSEGVVGTATVAVSTVPVASVSVTPASATIQENQTVQLTATVQDIDGNLLTGRAITWTTSNSAVATVSGSGLVSGKTAGSATITATSEGQTGTAAITVTLVPVASVTVAPSSAMLDVGKTLQLTGTPKDANGKTLTGRTVTWKTSDAGTATVSSTGLVTGVAAGPVTITATSEGVDGTSAITITTPPPPGSGVVLVGAGDIAGCSSSGDEATADLLDNIPGTVFTAGDNVYQDGTATEFADCYEPSWGRHKARTRPSPGNHDYHTSSGAPYYAYFGANAGPAGLGYYSYDLGAWHIISLNSNISMSRGSTQEQWLRADLAASSAQCTLAYWHHPRFSDGEHGSSTKSSPVWDALYEYGAEVAIVGHDHIYERYAPQTSAGVRDDAQGIREFVAGMGGRSHYSMSTPDANAEAWNTDTYGVLKLTLYPDRYEWEFVPVAGKTYTDSGSANCH